MALDPGRPVVVPFNFRLYKLAQRHGIQPWVFEGEPPDRPPLLWLIRLMEFSRMETSVSVRSHG